MSQPDPPRPGPTGRRDGPTGHALSGRRQALARRLGAMTGRRGAMTGRRGGTTGPGDGELPAHARTPAGPDTGAGPPAGRAGDGPARRVAVAATALVVAAVLPTPVRILVAPPLALLVPGFAVTTAALGPRRPRLLPARVALWLAVSLAVLALGTTLLALPGLHLTEARVLVLAATVPFGAVVVLTRRAVRTGDDQVVSGATGGRRAPFGGPTPIPGPAPARLAPGPNPVRPLPAPPPTPPSRLVVAAFGAGVAGLLAVVVVAAAVHRPPVEFSTIAFAGIDPIEPLAHPGTAPASVTVTVTNHTYERQRYRVAAGIDGAAAWTPRSIELEPEETWLGTLAGPVPPSGCWQRIAVELEAPGRPAIRVTRWVAGIEGLRCQLRPRA